MPADGTTQDVTGGQDTEKLQIYTKNHAKGMEEDKLLEIGMKCKAGFEDDLQSRSDWDDALEDWMELAAQHNDRKNTPWQNASNVKYPLVTTAAMQFSARAYPALIPANGKVVNAKVIGKDPTGEKLAHADRVSTFMSYQVMNDIDDWEENMDKMLMMLPIVGTVFKKTWYDKTEDKIISRPVHPKNFVVNYWAESIERAERTSEIIPMPKRILKEKQNSGEFLDIDLGEAPLPENDSGFVASDETVPYTIIEQHTFLDLDDDDYAEPYVVTFHLETGKVLSIYRRHTLEDVVEEDGKLVRIKPTVMYTKFGFVPNPNGSFYDIGFGVLLGPINASVNTLINQLIDSGTLNNLQSGFIGKSLKLKMGDASFSPGEWKPVNAGADDLRKQIIPLPTKEPSNVLFQLMGSLITSGKELASVAEIFTGKMPGQNTPATTTMATVEQGMKVFTAVYKRIYRALDSEFAKIFKLNKTYLDPETYVSVLDEPVGPDDFDDKTFDIYPGADPSATSSTEKLMKAQGLMEMLPLVPGILDPIKVFSRVLEAQEQPNWQDLFTEQVKATGQVPPPPPDPKLMAIQAKVQADQQKAQMDIQQKQMEMELDARDKTMQMQMKQQEHAQKMQQTIESAKVKAASDIHMANIFAATERQKAQQGLQQSQQQHEQKMQQTKESQSLAQNSNSGSGKPTQSQGNSGKTSGKSVKK
jgi:chaperonin GroES